MTKNIKDIGISIPTWNFDGRKYFAEVYYINDEYKRIVIYKDGENYSHDLTIIDENLKIFRRDDRCGYWFDYNK